MLKTKQIKAIARETLVGRYGTPIGAYAISLCISFFCSLLTFFAMYAAFGKTESTSQVHIIRNGQEVLETVRSDPKLSFLAVLLAFTLLFLTFVVVAWLDFGRKKLMLELCRKEETEVTTLFWCFRHSAHPWKLVAAKFLVSFFTAAPGVIPLLVWMTALATGHARDVATSGTVWFNVLTATALLTELVMIYLALGMVYSDVVLLENPETGVMDAIARSFRIMRGKKFRFLWTASISFLFWFLAMSIAPLAALWIMPYVEATIMVFYLNISGEVQDTAAYRRLYVTTEAMPEPAPAAEPVQTEASEPVQAAEPVPVIAPEPAAEPTAAPAPENEPVTAPEPEPAAEPVPAEPAAEPAPAEPAAEPALAEPVDAAVNEAPATPDVKEGENHEMPVL